MKKVVAYILSQSEIKLELFVIVVKAILIIGYKINEAMSVNLADQDSLYEVEQLWKVLNYPL
jgi:hypothetical protein